ncbi:hypothetical protein EDD17DRAFT_1615939 [Pisolithus thermaeus]|nr:hypothetical protein EDD17DRAFT_1615939 [Pisolithus thermaeus]
MRKQGRGGHHQRHIRGGCIYISFLMASANKRPVERTCSLDSNKVQSRRNGNLKDCLPPCSVKNATTTKPLRLACPITPSHSMSLARDCSGLLTSTQETKHLQLSYELYCTWPKFRCEVVLELSRSTRRSEGWRGAPSTSHVITSNMRRSG